MSEGMVPEAKNQKRTYLEFKSHAIVHEMNGNSLYRDSLLAANAMLKRSIREDLVINVAQLMSETSTQYIEYLCL